MYEPPTGASNFYSRPAELCTLYIYSERRSMDSFDYLTSQSCRKPRNAGCPRPLRKREL